MYYAGVFDFSSENISNVKKEATLKFPLRVPLEHIINTRKRQREGANEGEGDEGDVSAALATLERSGTLTPSSSAALRQMSAINITSVANGVKHSVMAVNGVLFGMGANVSHQLGGGTIPTQVNVWRELSLSSPAFGLSSPVVKVACGRKHTMALLANGELYTTGDNSFSQLGHSNRKGDWAAVRVGTNNVTQIACGLDCSYALTSDGHVYSWGRGEHLALGHPITVIEGMHPTTLLPIFLNIDTPMRIEGFVSKRVKILEISAGTEHLVARDDKDVYTCGQNSFGKLGTGNVEDHLTPYRVQFQEKKTVEKLLQVAAVGRTTLVLKHNPDFGNITYIFGKEGNSLDGTLLPRIVTDAPLSITRLLGTGPNNSVYSAVTDDGTLYTWGHSTVMPSVLRTGETSSSRPTPITLLRDKCIVKDVAMGNGNIVVIIADIQSTLKAAAEEIKHRDPNSDDASAEVPRFRPDSLLRSVVIPYYLRSSLMAMARTGVRARDVFDEASEAFYKQMLGEVDGSSFWSSTEKPPPYDPSMFKPKLNKQGTKALHVGSRVRLWMTDVYALGTITNANPLGLTPQGVTAASPSLGNAGEKPHGKTPLQQHAQPAPALSLAGGSDSHALLSAATLETASASSPNLDGAVHERNHHFEVTWVRDDWDPEIVELYSDDETVDSNNGNRWQKAWFLTAPDAGSI